MFIGSEEQVVPVPRVPPSRSSPRRVSLPPPFQVKHSKLTLMSTDSKQARDLIAVLQESKQQIDPRLSEMARYGGGGGGMSRYGGRGGRGGGGGGRSGGGFTSSNSAPLGGSRRW